VKGGATLGDSIIERGAATIAAALVGVILVGSGACSSDEEGGSGTTSSPSERGVVTPGPDGQLAIVAGDNWFGSEGDQRARRVKIVVQAGQNVDLVMKNEGGVNHNVHFAGYDGDYGTDDDEGLITDPEAVRGGKTGSFSFTLDEAGRFDFQCDFHAAEMFGAIVVE
jgi:plastocyanin